MDLLLISVVEIDGFESKTCVYRAVNGLKVPFVDK